MNRRLGRTRPSFGRHPHQDMDRHLRPRLHHSSTMTAWATARCSTPGELPRMSAGPGVEHSEFNPSADDTLHLYQIWTLPAASAVSRPVTKSDRSARARSNRLRLVASHDVRDSSLTIHRTRAFTSQLGCGVPSVTHVLAAHIDTPGCMCSADRLGSEIKNSPRAMPSP